MSAGTIAAEFLPGQWSQEKITHAAFSNYLDRVEDGQGAATEDKRSDGVGE
jgi:hypothetical protein